MSTPEFDPTGFDVLRVAQAVGIPPLIDMFGLAHLIFATCELTLAPSGRTARCDVATPAPSGRLAHRSLDVDTDGAVLAAMIALLHGITAIHPDVPLTERAEHMTMYSSVLLSFPFDE